jgi:hypothetical protein
MQIPPLLAFDADYIGIIILVLSVLGMFVRAIKGNNEHANPPVPKNRPEKLRTEIEEFLDEIAGNSSKKPTRPAPEQPRPARARPPVKQQQPKKPAAKAKPVVKQQSQPAKPVKLSEQHLQPSNLGAELRSHLATYMQSDRVGQEVQRDLKNRIAEEVEADLGRPAASNSSATGAVVHPLAKLLREPQGVRTAIALQEILQKPRALR